MNDVLPGQPLAFPLQAHDGFERMNEHMDKNCTSDDETVEAECLALLQERITRCRGEPVVASNQEEWRVISRQYLNCILPYPICNGIEVRNEDEFKRHCSPARSTSET